MYVWSLIKQQQVYVYMEYFWQFETAVYLVSGIKRNSGVSQTETTWNEGTIMMWWRVRKYLLDCALLLR